MSNKKNDKKTEKKELTTKTENKKVKDKKVETKKNDDSKTVKSKSSSKKKSVHTTTRLKTSFKLFIGVVVTATVLGLIFMNPMFTGILVGGIILIVLISNLINRIKHKWIRVIFNIFAILILLACIAGVGGALWFINYIKDNAPEFNEDKLYMSQTTIIYDAENQVIAELGTEKRKIIKYDEMSEEVIDALVATEDSRFFQHNGFDAPRFLIASIKQILLRDEDAGGASTLTMQVAKNTYNKEQSKVTKGFAGIVRKFTDIYMAVFKIEKNYSKEEIIEFYLNYHFLGNNAYGVEQAAKTYFNKSAKDLNLAEASMIIGLYQAPTTYNPYTNPTKAEERRGTVLNLMHNHGYITKEERDIAKAIPITSLLQSSKEEQKYYSYLNTVVEEAIDKYKVNPHTNSLLIYTNMNQHHQQVLDDVLSGKAYRWDNDEVQAGFAVVDVHNGKVLAIGGGRNQDGDLKFNYATSTRRQIGSTAKPLFDYGPGIEFNNWSTGKLFDDKRYFYSSGQEIHDSDRQYKGIMTLRSALAQSRNIPALQAFQQVDNKSIYNFVTSLGIDIEEESKRTGFLHEAYSIGAFNGSNPLTMAAAYAAFANGGYYFEPYTINKIVYRDTNEVITYESEGKKVMSDATAYMITDVLKSAVAPGGASTYAAVPGVNVAAKTGTTNYTASILYQFGLPLSALNDSWIIGYDPDLSIGFWYGYEPISRKYYTDGNASFRNRRDLWAATAGKIFAKNGKDFAMPSSVVRVGTEVNPDINSEPKLPSPYTPQTSIIYELFKRGTEPTEMSTYYVRAATPANFSVTYDPNKKFVNMSWSPVGQPFTPDPAYGVFGYKIIKNNVQIDFTTNTIYTINNATDPNGTYAVIAGFANNGTNDSPGAIKELNYVDNSMFDSQLVVPSSKTYHVGDNLEPYDNTPSLNDIKLTESGNVVNLTSGVSFTITNSAGQTPNKISTAAPDTFTVTYKLTYKTYTKTFTRTVTVVEKPNQNENQNEKEENTNP